MDEFDVNDDQVVPATPPPAGVSGTRSVGRSGVVAAAVVGAAPTVVPIGSRLDHGSDRIVGQSFRRVGDTHIRGPARFTTRFGRRATGRTRRRSTRRVSYRTGRRRSSGYGRFVRRAFRGYY